PRAARRREARAAVLAAEREARRAARVHQEESEPRPAAIDLAHEIRVAGRGLVAAERDLAEELRVIGHGREVERPREVHAAERAAVRIEGMEPDRLALREAVGGGGRRARALGARVERPARVDVEIAEEGALQRLARRAGGRLLRARSRQQKRGAAERAQGESQRAHQSKTPISDEWARW